MRSMTKSEWLRAVSARLVGISILVALTGEPAESQGRWSWPEKTENLQVLPEEIPPEELGRIMRGFTRALGVRCSHCHVGREDQPLSAYDFPSDEKAAKRTARQMLRMVQAINGEHLAEMDSLEGPAAEVTCATCHHGQTRPVTLEAAMEQAFAEGGAEAAVARFRELRESHYGSSAYDFSERSVSRIGRDLLLQGKTAEALAILRLNVEHFPESGRAHREMGDAFQEMERKDLARVFYEKALLLDPEDPWTARRLAELESARATNEQKTEEP